MKKIISVLFLLAIVAVPLTISAQQTIPEGITDPQQIINTIESIGNWIFSIFLALSAIFILWAAFKFLTASGDAGKVGEAKQSLVYALVGIAVAVLAKGLVSLVENFLL